MKTIQELQQELAKHRKLLHRAVGNQILPYINFHHFECVRIISEIQSEEQHKKRLRAIGVDVKDGKNLYKMLSDGFLKKQDEEILGGDSSAF